MAVAIGQVASRTVQPVEPNPPRMCRHPQAVVANTLTTQRSSTVLLAIFASVALVMALIGVFGVLSYTVSQRTREIGIRMALGANGSAVQRLIVGSGIAQLLLGVGLGLVGAFALTRVIATMLFEISATDPLTLAAVALALVATGSLAAYLPALRASRTDPMKVLKED